MPNAPPCPNAEDSNPCDAVNYALRKRANENCKILRSPLFAACHSVSIFSALNLMLSLF